MSDSTVSKQNKTVLTKKKIPGKVLMTVTIENYEPELHKSISIEKQVF